MLVRSRHELMTSIFKYMIVSYMQTTLSLLDEESYCFNRFPAENFAS